MELTKRKIGSLIEQHNKTCEIPNLSANDVSGINREKEFFEPARQVGTDTSGYLVVPHGYFACNLMHVGRDCVLPIALNMTKKNKIVSPAYSVFCIKYDAPIINEYFYILVNSIEKDRFFWFHSDSSVRDGLPWDAFCDIEIELPPLTVQQKYVDIYKAMVANQQSYERGLDDLKLVCDGYIEDLRRKMPCEKIGQYLIICDCKNDIGLSVESVRGISTGKEFIFTKANMDGVSLSNYKVVKPKQIAYVADTSRRGNKISLAINDTQDDYLVSSISIVFDTNKDKLLPEYLMLFFTRPEFDRYTRFNSWGSARETFEWDDMCNVEIPIPDISIQKAIADIYKVYTTRKQINEQLKEQIKNICPILIKGSLEEGKK